MKIKSGVWAWLAAACGCVGLLYSMGLEGNTQVGAAYEVGGATEGIARAKAVEAAKAAKPEYDWFRVYHVEKLK